MSNSNFDKENWEFGGQTGKLHKYSIGKESWEVGDASHLFPEYLHTNKLTKIDRPKDMQKVDPQADQDNLGDSQDSSQDATPPEDGAQYCEANDDKGHHDELYEMEAGPEDTGTPDDQDVKADRSEDLRTEQDEESQSSPEDEKPESKPEEQDGAEKPIQKDSEGIDEVAEATSKTSEDVHGGDEATKDIEDSPNAADDGQNEDNHGAEKGQGGEDGEGDEGEGGDSATPNSNSDSADGENQTSKGSGESAFGDTEEWEKKADTVAWAGRMEKELKAWAEDERSEEAGGGGAGVDYSGYDQWTPEDAKTIFFKVRELIIKLVSQTDPSKKVKGKARWWVEQLVKEATGFKHHKIPQAKFNRPMKNNIVFFMDISESVSSLAELFMALMGGAAGLPGVRIVVGSEAHAESEIPVTRPFKNVEQAMDYFRKALSGETASHSMSSNAIVRESWYRPYDYPFEPGVVQYLKDSNLYNTNTTCIFFGDMQGVHFDVKALKEIVRTCQCLWLFTNEPGHYTHRGDLPKAIEAKLPMVYNVRGARAFLKAVRRLRVIRPGMQIIP